MPDFVAMFFFAATAVVVATLLLTRHKERMTIIDKGLKAEDYTSLYRNPARQVYPLSSLKWGLIFILVGVAVLVGLWLRQMYSVEEGVFFGLVALGAGIGLVAFYAIAKKQVRA